jgi:hypothetical protein
MGQFRNLFLQIAVVAIFGLVAIIVSSQAPKTTAPATQTATSPAAPVSSVCKPNPQEHVYNPDRLQVIDPCKTVTGTVDFVRSEPDGDYHIGVKLDPQFADLVNSCNLTCANGAERGDLVVEPVCEMAVTQTDAVATCAGVAPSVPKPSIGQHVTVTGPYVKDLNHGWNEIHPAWEIKPI